MNNIINIPDRDIGMRQTIDTEARAWLVQLDAEAPAGQTLREFHAWLGRSPYHRDAFRRAVAAWGELDELGHLLDFQMEGLPASSQQREAYKFRHMFAGIALFGILITGWLGFENHYLSDQDAAFVAEHETVIGETRSVLLPDGSNVRINTDSNIRIHYGDDARMVYLSKGEAWFDVRSDPDRPFIVYAGKFAVQAVGTAFSVYDNNGKIDLTVTEGRVEVALLESGVVSMQSPDLEYIKKANYRIPVVAGQHMVLDEDINGTNDKIEFVQQVQQEEIDKQLSWRDGILRFDNDPLDAVVARISRYTPIKIVISESDLKDLRFGGYFQAKDATMILATLEENYGIQVDEVEPGLVLLSRQQPH